MSNPLALIIEDDSKLAYLFAEALQMAEFETETIQNGQIALDRLAVTVPTVVVLDLHLPDLSGSDILAYIRSDQRLDPTRVMIVTADAFKAEHLRSEADLVLLKPVSLIQLSTLASRLRPLSAA
ncbi:MAG: response regulator transcription factor [Anaerolineae bacterium]|nr:response regulator transcription factor [Anaerolineae bacterium]